MAVPDLATGAVEVQDAGVEVVLEQDDLWLVVL